MFKKLRLTSKIENALMLTFTLIFLIFISISPDMNLESLKGVLIIGITVGIIYGLVAVGISLIYTGLDVVNFSHGEFFMLGAFTGLTVYNFLIDGEIIYKNTVNSNKEGDRKIFTNTIFPIWSMSKPITIVAMMTLFEDGKIDFNDNVSKYLPSFKKIKCKGKVDEIYDCKNSLKILHLMTHRAGYKYYNWILLLQ